MIFVKKLFGFVGMAFASLLVLTSCKSNKDLTTLRCDEVNDTIKAKYNIDFNVDDENESIRLFNSERSAKTTSYYDVYIAKEYKDSLISYTITLDEIINKQEDKDKFVKKIEKKKLKSVAFNSLFFSNTGTELYSDEQTAFIKEIYNSKYGINSTYKDDSKNVVKNYDFGFDIDSKTEWDRTLKTNYVTEAYLAGRKDISFNVIYLPLFLRRVYKGTVIVEKYAFLPISEVALYDGKQIVAPTTKGEKYSLADYTISAEEVEFDFNAEDNLLIMD